MHKTHTNAAKEMQIVRDSSYRSPINGFRFYQSRMVLKDFGAQFGMRAGFSLKAVWSADLEGDRHTEADHDVHDFASDSRLDLLGAQSPSAKAAPN